LIHLGCLAALASIAIGLPVLSTTSASSPVGLSATHHAIDVTFECRQAETQPQAIAFDCRGGVVAKSIRWSYYPVADDIDHAAGHGTLVANSCRPGCAFGTISKYPVHIRLENPVLCSGYNVKEFQRAVLTFTQGRPRWAHQTQSWNHLGCSTPAPSS
jgi:hypothetical protein